ncbi:hypothetical protein [uncultured Methylobacterium sp.]|uniref:hypothetical protein n=1 Tax=uncultured Methylobacterium sp. TaxID=157278 RepID=UPI0035CB61D8
MSDRRSCRPVPFLLAVLSAVALPALTPPAAAEPAVTVLDLPFRATAMRGPRSEVSVAVATSGLIPLARPRASGAAPEAGEEEGAPLVVVWGEGGGAALSLVEGAIRTTLLGAEAIEGLAAAETPRGALPGSRRALSGATSAHLSGSTRATGADAPAAAGLTIRERRPVAMGGEPKPVPVSTVTVPAGPDGAFAPFRPRALRLSGRLAFVAATLGDGDRCGLAVIARAGIGDWAVAARTPPQEGAPMKIAAVWDFTGAGALQVATVRGKAGMLQLWTTDADPMTLAGEAPGYAAGTGDAELAAILNEGAGAPDLALPTIDGAALALVSLKGGIRERARIALPAPAAFGVSALGEGRAARLLVGLADGRIAVVAPGGTRP